MAKQFAAQQAMAFIQQRSSTPSAAPTSSVTTAQITTTTSSLGIPEAKRARLDADHHLRSPSSLGQQRGSASPGGKNGSSSESSTENPSIFECVARKARRLGMDQPRYNVVREDGTEFSADLYRGQAEFRIGTKVPENVGIVRGILGKSEAKIEIAQQVLAWMQKELDNRHDMIKKIVGEEQFSSTMDA